MKNPDLIVRRGPADHGVVTELKNLEAPTTTAVKRSITDAGGQLAPGGGGDVVIDGRAVGLTRDTAEAGWRRTVGQARKHGQPLPRSVTIVLADGTTVVFP